MYIVIDVSKTFCLHTRKYVFMLPTMRILQQKRDQIKMLIEFPGCNRRVRYFILYLSTRRNPYLVGYVLYVLCVIYPPKKKHNVEIEANY